MNKYNSINFLLPEELAAMKHVRLEVTKATIGKDDVQRHMFSAIVKFAKDVEYSFSITRDEYALLRLKKESKFVVDQFEIDAKCRFLETKWPGKDGGPEHSTMMLQICVDDDKELRWEFDITRSKFEAVYKKYSAAGNLIGFEPCVRIPGVKETEVIQEVKTEDTPF